MSFHIVIAVRGGRIAKSRLSDRLSEQQRSALVEAMLTDMLTTLQSMNSVNSIWVVTPTPALVTIATKSGVNTLTDIGTNGLNGAFGLARARIAELDPGGTILLLPGDVPLVSAYEVDALLHASTKDTISIAPANRDGGTAALSLIATCPMTFAFGLDSFTRHIHAARDQDLNVRVITAPNIGLDIDYPADLDAFLDQGAYGSTALLLRNWKTAVRVTNA